MMKWLYLYFPGVIGETVPHLACSQISTPFLARLLSVLKMSFSNQQLLALLRQHGSVVESPLLLQSAADCANSGTPPATDASESPNPSHEASGWFRPLCGSDMPLSTTTFAALTTPVPLEHRTVWPDVSPHSDLPGGVDISSTRAVRVLVSAPQVTQTTQTEQGRIENAGSQTETHASDSDGGWVVDGCSGIAPSCHDDGVAQDAFLHIVVQAVDRGGIYYVLNRVMQDDFHAFTDAGEGVDLIGVFSVVIRRNLVAAEWPLDSMEYRLMAILDIMLRWSTSPRNNIVLRCLLVRWLSFRGLWDDSTQAPLHVEDDVLADDHVRGSTRTALLITYLVVEHIATSVAQTAFDLGDDEAVPEDGSLVRAACLVRIPADSDHLLMWSIFAADGDEYSPLYNFVSTVLSEKHVGHILHVGMQAERRGVSIVRLIRQTLQIGMFLNIGHCAILRASVFLNMGYKKMEIGSVFSGWPTYTVSDFQVKAQAKSSLHGQEEFDLEEEIEDDGDGESQVADAALRKRVAEGVIDHHVVGNVMRVHDMSGMHTSPDRGLAEHLETEAPQIDVDRIAAIIHATINIGLMTSDATRMQLTQARKLLCLLHYMQNQCDLSVTIIPATTPCETIGVGFHYDEKFKCLVVYDPCEKGMVIAALTRAVITKASVESLSVTDLAEWVSGCGHYGQLVSQLGYLHDLLGVSAEVPSTSCQSDALLVIRILTWSVSTRCARMCDKDVDGVCRWMLLHIEDRSKEWAACAQHARELMPGHIRVWGDRVVGQSSHVVSFVAYLTLSKAWSGISRREAEGVPINLGGMVVLGLYQAYVLALSGTASMWEMVRILYGSQAKLHQRDQAGRVSGGLTHESADLTLGAAAGECAPCEGSEAVVQAMRESLLDVLARCSAEAHSPLGDRGDKIMDWLGDLISCGVDLRQIREWGRAIPEVLKSIVTARNAKLLPGEAIELRAPPTLHALVLEAHNSFAWAIEEKKKVGRRAQLPTKPGADWSRFMLRVLRDSSTPWYSECKDLPQSRGSVSGSSFSKSAGAKRNDAGRSTDAPPAKRTDDDSPASGE